VYTYTRGRVLDAIKNGLKEMMAKLPANAQILGVGVTGSSGELAKSILNADIYKTEIYSHAAATINQIPDVKTILEIGGQDSKVIYVNNGIPEKSKMNEWCGAGTGAMLDAQANRLGLSIQEFSEMAVKARKSIDFRTRCGVFMDSCMIDAQAKGYPIEVIIRGLCNACAHNFISTLGINRKSIEQPIAFQGGVSANKGVRKELEDYISEAKGEKVHLIVPLHHDVMGAIGMALIVGKMHQKTGRTTSFRGLDEIEKITPEIKECDLTECPKNLGTDRRCDIVKLRIGAATIAAVGACEDYYKSLQPIHESEPVKEEAMATRNEIKVAIDEAVG
jgi:predicted CoA-substrate-specific enzyme activase